MSKYHWWAKQSSNKNMKGLTKEQRELVVNLEKATVIRGFTLTSRAAMQYARLWRRGLIVKSFQDDRMWLSAYGRQLAARIRRQQMIAGKRYRLLWYDHQRVGFTFDDKGWSRWW